MSERKAKQLRKQTAAPSEKPVKKQKSLFNIVAVIVVVAVAGLAGYGIWSATRPEVQTFATALESQGTDFDTAVEDWGLDTSVFTADMPSEDASMLFTLENMAKMNEKEVEDFVAELEIPEDVPTNVASKDLSTDVMLKANGISMTVEELRSYGLSEDITEETLWADSNEQVIEAYYAAMMAQYEAEAEAETESEGEE